MPKAITPGWSYRALAMEAIPEGRLFTIAPLGGYVTMASPATIAQGVAIEDCPQGEMLGRRAEWFKKGCIVSLPIATEHIAGELVSADTEGRAAIQYANDEYDNQYGAYCWGVCLQSGSAGTEAEVMCLF